MAMDPESYRQRTPGDEVNIGEIAKLLLQTAAPGVHFDGRHRLTREETKSLDDLKDYIRANSRPEGRAKALKQFHDKRQYKDFGLEELAQAVGVTRNGGKIQDPPLSSEKFSGSYAKKESFKTGSPTR